MENNDVILLQKEIGLNKRIIESLLSANEELRDKCCRLSSIIEAKLEFYSPAEAEMIAKHLLYSPARQSMGTNQSSHSPTRQGNGMNEEFHSTARSDMEISELSDSAARTDMETNEPFHSPAQSGSGINESFPLHTQSGSGMNEVIPLNTATEKAANQPADILPSKIDVTKMSVLILRSLLRAHIQYKGRESAMRSATRILIHIYNDGNCDYDALCKATDLSTGGLAKLMMRLRKKGLIQRTAFQKFALTEPALNLLKQAWAQSPK